MNTLIYWCGSRRDISCLVFKGVERQPAGGNKLITPRSRISKAMTGICLTASGCAFGFFRRQNAPIAKVSTLSDDCEH
jgi:hypothetical protein